LLLLYVFAAACLREPPLTSFERCAYFVSPLPSSHRWIKPATSALFLSIMIMNCP
jgi:hypothetical protein